MKVICCVASYNRKNLLLKCIDALYSQTYQIESILIFDNNSDFDIYELFENKKKYPNIKIIKSTSNIGSSGAFNSLTKFAIQTDIDFVWYLDDDVAPANNCLEELVKHADSSNVLIPLKFYNGKCVELSARKLDFKNPFRIDPKREIIMNCLDSIDDLELISVKTVSFEGLFISKSVINKIGLPVSNFFICHDDLEYSLRILKHNEPIRLVKKAILNREYDVARFKTLISWKAFFAMRNYVLVNKLYGHNLFWFIRPTVILIALYFSLLFKLKNPFRLDILKGYFAGFNFKPIH